MPELRSRARDSDFSLIDLPRTEPIDDLPAYLQAALRWHFSPETGSPYWLKRAKALDFNSLTDVTTFEDLALFPNVVDELRDVDVRDRNGYRQSVFWANTLSHPDDLRAAVAVVESNREIGNCAPLRPFARREVTPGNLTVGSVLPNTNTGLAYHCFMTQGYPRIKEVIEQDLGSAQIFLPSHATDFKNAEVRPYLNNYSGNHEAIPIEILVAQDALGLTETYRRFAAACLNEYDLDGWTVPDLVNPDGGNSSANPTTDCAEPNHGASTPHTEPIRRAAQTNRVRIKRPTLRRRSDSRLTTRSDVVRQKECGEPFNKGVHPS